MKKPLIIYGAGENSTLLQRPEYQESLRPYTIIGFIDDNKTGKHEGLPVLGTRKELDDLRRNKGVEHLAVSLTGTTLQTRLELLEELQTRGFQFPNIIGAYLPPTYNLGVGIFIHHKAELMGTNTTIGDFSSIAGFNTTEGGVTIGKGVFVGPYSFIGHHSTIQQSTYLGIRATILPRTIIEEQCTIGPHVIAKRHVRARTKQLRR